MPDTTPAPDRGPGTGPDRRPGAGPDRLDRLSRLVVPLVGAAVVVPVLLLPVLGFRGSSLLLAGGLLGAAAARALLPARAVAPLVVRTRTLDVLVLVVLAVLLAVLAATAPGG
ncbi:DUF3017 domain-containing protein [Quadrisphaera sp. GCM10027208]|uniref:DUF3017 domain-containing protein n=1 Tax=Quadrisphaera sp. GCM10027208 TaxID=3273423 RepID=UPI00361E17E5